VKELYVLRTRNLNAPGKWTFRSQTQINQKWAKVVLSCQDKLVLLTRVVFSDFRSFTLDFMSGALSYHYGVVPARAQLTRNNLLWLTLADATFVR
jgi:hypothetical protein